MRLFSEPHPPLGGLHESICPVFPLGFSLVFSLLPRYVLLPNWVTQLVWRGGMCFGVFFKAPPYWRLTLAFLLPYGRPGLDWYLRVTDQVWLCVSEWPPRFGVGEFVLGCFLKRPRIGRSHWPSFSRISRVFLSCLCHSTLQWFANE